ncbi:MAG TPA: hypothetical protein DCF91_04005, partial [Porphyromonadaceae bacterium]|nr:hypothetical protein [Porphyromonadaceae bacterium]
MIKIPKFDMKSKLYIFAIIVFFLVCGSPFLFTLESDYFDFTKTGDIGSTIGGITAPIVGLASVFLLTYTFLEQISISTRQIEFSEKQDNFNKQQVEFGKKQNDFNNMQIEFNKKQGCMAFEEQFKSVYFSLLQMQRNIAESINGELFFLADKVSEEISDGYFKDKYKIFKADPSRAHKEIFTIKKREDINRTNGNQFFVNSRHQLQCLRFSIGYKKYYKDYDAEAAFDLEERLSDEYLNNFQYEYSEEEIDEKFSKRRAPLRAGYYNAKYGVSERAYNLYHQGDQKKKIAITYLHFYYKQPNLRHYFKHLLALLRYVKESEKECVKFESEQNELD